MKISTLIFPSLFTFALTSALAVTTHAQCVQVNSTTPTAAWNDNATGNWGFSSPSSALSSDNAYATATATLTLLSGSTDYLKMHGFGLSIPSGVTICGIQMTVKKKASGLNILSSVNDHRIRLMKSGVIVGFNRAKSAGWSGSETTSVYGGPSDLWGTSWTAADINNPSFGIAISAEINGLLSVLPSAHIDDVAVAVYYNHTVLPIRLVSFQGKTVSSQDVKLSWVTSGEDGNSGFIMQRSIDGLQWTDVGSVAADLTGNETKYAYTIKDNPRSKLYFRLAIRNSSGAVSYSEIISLMIAQATKVSLYPNPATTSITIESTSSINSARCFDAMGMLHALPLQKVSEKSAIIGVSPLSPGLYFIEVNGEMIKFLKK